jgi:HK97 family phage portal protein
MTMWRAIKAAFSPGKYLQSSVRRVGGFDRPMPRPFDQHAATERFRSWVYAAAMLNAQAMAAVPLRLYIRRRRSVQLFHTRTASRHRMRYLRGDRDDNLRPSHAVLNKVAQWQGDFDVVTDRHPVLNVLGSVNPYMNGFELTVLRMLYLQMTGNCYLHPVIDPLLGRPGELWLMPSQWTQIIPSRETFIEGYTYGQQLADRRFFAPDEVIHWKLPNLTDLHYGKGCLEAVWSALGLHESKRIMDQARFDNHARPDYLMVVKQGASGDALERFEKQIDAKLRGAERTGRFITVTGDVQAVPLNLPPDVIGDPDRVIEEIASAFGVPITKLLAGDPNRASAHTADAAWMRDTILPYCRLDEEKLNEKLLPLFGLEDDAVLAYDNPVPEDRKFTVQRHVQYVGAGIMTRDEARAELGLAPNGDGDQSHD